MGRITKKHVKISNLLPDNRCGVTEVAGGALTSSSFSNSFIFISISIFIMHFSLTYIDR